MFFFASPWHCKTANFTVLLNIQRDTKLTKRRNAPTASVREYLHQTATMRRSVIWTIPSRFDTSPT